MSRSFDRKALSRLDYEEVFSEAIRALEDCGFEVKNIDRSSGSITATTPVSFWSWGETIKVTVTSIEIQF